MKKGGKIRRKEKNKKKVQMNLKKRKPRELGQDQAKKNNYVITKVDLETGTKVTWSRTRRGIPTAKQIQGM